MLSLNIPEVTKVSGYSIGGVTINGKTYGVFTLPAVSNDNGYSFHKLVGVCGPNGKFVWVHKNYRKAL